MRQIFIDAALYYHENLYSPYGVKALNYLKEDRGLFEHVIKKYSIGTSVSVYGLYRHLIGKGHKHEDILKTKLVKMEENEFKFRDCFYDCVTIPVIKNGVPISFTSRALPNEGHTRHKHLSGASFNCPYNVDIFNSRIDYIIVTEAPIDCLTLVQAGFPAVSTFGMFKKGYSKYFNKDTEVFIMFDNDKDPKKGERGSVEGGFALYRDKGVLAKIAKLPIFGDVNELWLDSKSKFRDRIEESLSNAKTALLFPHFQELKEKERKRVAKGKSSKIKSKLFYKIKREVSILDVVSDYLKIESVGGSYRALCPFHNDGKTKSLFLYENTNTFYCYGCGLVGDQIEFVKSIEGLNFRGALELLSYKLRS